MIIVYLSYVTAPRCSMMMATNARAPVANGCVTTTAPSMGAVHPRRAAGARPPLVHPGNFLLATRDAGYKSIVQSVAELVDNALEAGAKSIAIDVVQSYESEHPVELFVTDDGTGMDPPTLSSALTFGGSSRFGDRSSLGRYGMGLPNGALSRARRVEVYTWREPGVVLMAYLDLDEAIAKRRRALAPIERVAPPRFVPDTMHGTVIRLRRCDRLEYKRIPALTNRLDRDLGRIYRRYLWQGIALTVNGRRVEARDPLLLRPRSSEAARLFGDALVYRLRSAYGEGRVEVRFSELPIERWHDLSVERKRQLGITNAPSVSIVRADREIDQGWYFMGSKRRENYDDWWRCEISFDPTLDELFGITNSKQTITPCADLLQMLASDLEPIARALNGRVRRKFELLKVASPLREAERQAARADPTLPALPRQAHVVTAEVEQVLQAHPDLAGQLRSPYRIVVTDLPSTAGFEVVVRQGTMLVLLNARHPFYRDLYGPLATSAAEGDQIAAKHVALAMLAAARAELGTRGRSARTAARRFRQAWADVIATFYNA